MNVSELKKAVQLCYKAQIPLMIWGHHGMGKSSVVQQCAQEMVIGFVDYRAAQIEATDLRGFPDKEEQAGPNGTRKEYTVYRPPEELPREGAGIFFLDELNRADDPVIQAAFQLIVERKLGTYSLPTSYDDKGEFSGWMIVSAGNYSKGYHVNDFCKAFIGRFAHVELKSSEDYMVEWFKYMTARHGDAASRVIQFIGSDQADLCTREKGEMDFKVEPSPRLWDAVGRLERYAPEYDREVSHAVRAGLIGQDLAHKFERATFEVEPKDVVNKGMAPVEAVKHKLSKELVMGLTWGIASYIRGLEKKVTKLQVHNVFDYIEWLADSTKYRSQTGLEGGAEDMALVLCAQILKPQFKDVGNVIVNNKAIAEILAKSGSLWVKEIQGREKVYELTKKIREV